MKNNKTYKSEIVEKILNESSPILKKQVSVKLRIALKIDEVRKNKGWSKLDLAKEFNKNPSVITRWLSGVHNFTTNTLIEIEEVLNIRLLAQEEKKEMQNIQYTAATDNDLEQIDDFKQICNEIMMGKEITLNHFFGVKEISR